MVPPEHLRITNLELAAGQEWIDEQCAWRIVRLRSGTAYWLDLTNPRALTEGELLVMAPNCKGTIRASQLGEAVLDWFLFDPNLLCGFFTVAERHWFEHEARKFISPIQFLPSTHPVGLDMTALLKRSSADAELIQRGETLILALRVLAPSLPVDGISANRCAAAEDRFRQIISRMPDTELIRHTSAELAQLCGCTPRHFNRLFRAQFGESPRARQTDLRLLKARQLLESAADDIPQIAEACGYSSLRLFSSLFRRRFGMSPLEWRQSAQKKAPVEHP
jgi:AraC-like DNA-binding protein